MFDIKITEASTLILLLESTEVDVVQKVKVIEILVFEPLQILVMFHHFRHFTILINMHPSAISNSSCFTTKNCLTLS